MWVFFLLEHFFSILVWFWSQIEIPETGAEFDLSCIQTAVLPLHLRSAAGIGQAGSYLLLGHKHLL